MCKQLKRFTLLLRRFLRAREFGVHFVGTKTFLWPRSIRWRDRSLFISAPEEAGVAWDFINLALDDEYGPREFRDKPKTVIDVGASVGLFSILAAHYFTNATIQDRGESRLAHTLLAESASGNVPIIPLTEAV